MKRMTTAILSFLCIVFAAVSFQIQTQAATEWRNNGIIVDKVSPQPKGTKINLTANISGDTAGLSYKFVWMKDNWAKWGVIEEFGSAKSATWTPTEFGDYTIYLDVKDSKNIIDTKTIKYTVDKGWSYSGISVDKSSPQLENTAIKLTANTAGQTSGLTYKFVWMKDGWSSWAVIKDFSSTNNTIWIPKAGGNYTLYVDVKGADNSTETKTINYTINRGWSYSGISVDKSSPQPENTAIRLTANTTGQASGLKYKFVWMKNGWSSWGVIKDFSNTNNTTWTPKEEGNYTLYVDVKGADNSTETKTINYTIDRGWSYSGISVDKSSPQSENTAIRLTANTVGQTSGLNYKFVWMKNGWSEWGVIKNFSSANSVTWTPSAPGDYTLYIDVKADGGTVTKSIDYKINPVWVNNGITLNVDPTQKLGAEFKLTANVSGNTGGLQYKYVWMKNNWSEWGVIKNFSKLNTASFKPFSTGIYNLYLDIKDPKGRVSTSSRSIEILSAQAVYGIDVSEHQGYIDWNAVKNSGVKFAIIRTGWLFTEDKNFRKNINGAKAAGIDVGVYHYSYAETMEDVLEEADKCLSLINGYKLEYPVFFDIEEDRIAYLGKRQLTDQAKAFCDRIESAGYYAGVYANPNWLNNYLYGDELTSRYDLWLAHYGVSEPSRNCGMWQYTSNGIVPGIESQYTDLNYAYKAYPLIMKEYHKNGY